MPHIVAEYSGGLSTDISALLSALHQSLGAEESVDITRVKTRAVEIEDYIVGNGGKEMIHITLRVMPRDVPVMKRMAVNLQKIAQDHAPQAAVTAEVVVLDKDTYCL